MLNTAFGAFAAYKAGPFQDAAASNYALFRKTWMKLPFRLGAFAGAYIVAGQLSTRMFPRLHYKYWKSGGMKEPHYMAHQDLIAKFRIFDQHTNADA